RAREPDRRGHGSVPQGVPRGLAVEDDVASGGGEAGPLEGDRVAQPVDVQVADRGDPLSNDLWRDAHGEPVDQTLAKRRGDDPAAALDEQGADAVAAQSGEQI